MCSKKNTDRKNHRTSNRKLSTKHDYNIIKKTLSKKTLLRKLLTPSRSTGTKAYVVHYIIHIRVRVKSTFSYSRFIITRLCHVRCTTYLECQMCDLNFVIIKISIKEKEFKI
jgi:hypothetical protein